MCEQACIAEVLVGPASFGPASLGGPAAQLRKKALMSGWHAADKCPLDVTYRTMPLEAGATGAEVHATSWVAGSELGFVFAEATSVELPHTSAAPTVRLVSGTSIEELVAGAYDNFLLRVFLLPQSELSSILESNNSFYFVSRGPMVILGATCRLPSSPSPPYLQYPLPLPPPPPKPPPPEVTCKELDIHWMWRPMPAPICEQVFGDSSSRDSYGCFQGMLRITPWRAGHTVWIDFGSALVHTLQSFLNGNLVGNPFPGLFGIQMTPWVAYGARGGGISLDSWSLTKRGLPERSTLCCWLSFEARGPIAGIGWPNPDEKS